MILMPMAIFWQLANLPHDRRGIVEIFVGAGREVGA